MGCFNTTGFISQLPIKYGDKVVCFIATSAVGDMSAPVDMYYPGSLVTPYFLPIYGEYNDYGYLENIEENQITQMICKYAEETNLETLLKNISRGEHVKLPNKYSIMEDFYSIGEFTLLFEHRDVYNEITKSETYLSDKFNNMYQTVDWFVDFMERLKEYTTDYVPPLPFNIAKDYFSGGFFNIDAVPEELKKEYEDHSTQCIRDRLGWSFRNDYTFFLFRMLSKEDNLQAMIFGKEEIRKFLNLYATYVCIPSYFKLSKTAGEQSYSLKDFRKIYDIIGNKLTELENKEVEEKEE